MSKSESYQLSINTKEFTRTYTLKVYEGEKNSMKKVSLFIKDTLPSGEDTSHYQTKNFSKQPLNKFDIIIDSETNMNTLISQLALNHDNDLSKSDPLHIEIVDSLKSNVIIKISDEENNEGFLPG